MSRPQNITEFIEHLTDGWNERNTYHLDERDLDLLLLQDGAETSTKGNGDGTVTVTVTFQGKQFICTKQAAFQK